MIKYLLPFLFAASLFGAEPEKTEPKTPTLTQTRDAFLAFALDKAKTYTGKIEDAVSKGVDMAMTEGPELAREYLRWKSWQHLIKFAIWPSIVLFFLSLILLQCLTKWGGKMISESDGISVAIPGFVMLFCGLGTLMNLDELMSFIQIQVAPRVYLIEQVSHLLK